MLFTSKAWTHSGHLPELIALSLKTTSGASLNRGIDLMQCSLRELPDGSPPKTVISVFSSNRSYLLCYYLLCRHIVNVIARTQSDLRPLAKRTELVLPVSTRKFDAKTSPIRRVVCDVGQKSAYAPCLPQERQVTMANHYQIRTA
jgi:hypothetical protein